MDFKQTLEKRNARDGAIAITSFSSYDLSVARATGTLIALLRVHSKHAHRCDAIDAAPKALPESLAP